MAEYKTLEQQIQELWKSVDEKIYEWIIHAKRED